jgi:hypothetical protein
LGFDTAAGSTASACLSCGGIVLFKEILRLAFVCFGGRSFTKLTLDSSADIITVISAD